jgi:hypothetical protein
MSTSTYEIAALRKDPEKAMMDIITQHARANGIDPEHVAWELVTMAGDSILAPVTSGPKKGVIRIKISSTH